MKKYLILALLAMVTTSLKAQQWNFNEVDYTPQKTTFRLFAPPKAKVSVLYSKDAQNSNCQQNRKHSAHHNTLSLPFRSLKENHFEIIVLIKGLIFRNKTLAPYKKIAKENVI